MRIVALEQIPQRRHELAHPGARAERVEAWQQAFVFEGICTARNAEVETPVARSIDHAGFAREADRMPERCNHRAGAETDAFGARSKVRQVDEGVRRDREFHGVVLADPRGFEAALFCDLDELGEFVEELPMRRVRVVTLHMEKQREFHDRPMGKKTVRLAAGAMNSSVPLRVDRLNVAAGITVFHRMSQIKRFNIMVFHNIRCGYEWI